MPDPRLFRSRTQSPAPRTRAQPDRARRALPCFRHARPARGMRRPAVRAGGRGRHYRTPRAPRPSPMKPRNNASTLQCRPASLAKPASPPRGTPSRTCSATSAPRCAPCTLRTRAAEQIRERQRFAVLAERLRRQLDDGIPAAEAQGGNSTRYSGRTRNCSASWTRSRRSNTG